MQAQCELRNPIWRYVPTMKHFHLFPILSVVAFGAWGQPPVSRNTGPGQTAPEQRRAELRSVLMEPRVRELQEKDQIFENVGYDRHLSVQERADLRQQLRQQQVEVKAGRP
jgi:hypothetical protein